nr:hypothetical protein HK105_007992 [Polyrhizophydium stewartii]
MIQGDAVFASPAPIRARPAVFGSPTAHGRAAPHVVFLVDVAGIPPAELTEPATTATTAAAADAAAGASPAKSLLLAAVLRTLIIDSSNVQGPASTPLRDAKQVLDLSPGSVARFHTALVASLAAKAGAADAADTGGPSLPAVFRACHQLLVQAPWHWCATGPYQSPIQPKATRLGSAKGTIRTRSHLVVVARVPGDARELQLALGLGHAMMQGDVGPGRLLALLTLGKGELLPTQMWEDFAGQRVGVSWIDPAVPDPAGGRAETELIRAAVAAMMRSLGGSLLRASELARPPQWMGLTTALAVMHPRAIDSVFARAAVGAKKASELLGVFEHMAAPIGSLKYPCLLRTSIDLADLASAEPDLPSSVAIQVTFLTRTPARFQGPSPFSQAQVVATGLISQSSLPSDDFIEQAFACIHVDAAIDGVHAVDRLGAAIRRVDPAAGVEDNPFQDTAPAVDTAGPPARTIETRTAVLMTLVEFVSTWLPRIYDELVQHIEGSPDDTRDATDVLLEYYASKLMMSISALEARHRRLPMQLAQAFAHADGKATAALEGSGLAAGEWDAARQWVLRVRSALGSDKRDDGEALRREVRRQARDLRTNEALLQITLWMECLRIHADTGCELPKADLLALEGGGRSGSGANASKCKGKSNASSGEADMRTHIACAVDELMDRVSIWTAVANLDGGADEDEAGSGRDGQAPRGSRLWRQFVSPVAVVL